MRTRQYFQFDKVDDHKGSWVQSGYLLMPGEVDEFKSLVELLGFPYAFSRITGKDFTEFRNVKLVVEIIPEEYFGTGSRVSLGANV